MSNQNPQYHYYYASGVRQYPEPAPPPRHHRRRWLKGIIIVVVVVGLGIHFFGGDHHPHASAKTPAAAPKISLISSTAMDQAINSIITNNPDIDIARSEEHT